MSAFKPLRSEPSKSSSRKSKASHSLNELAASVETAAPLRFAAAIADGWAMCGSDVRHAILKAAAADEQANKHLALKMRGYTMASIGHAIKEDLFDSGVLPKAGRATLKTLVALAHLEFGFFAGALPLTYGLSSLASSPSLLAAGQVALAGIVSAATIHHGIKAYRGVDKSFDDAARASTLPSGRRKRRNALSGLIGRVLRAVNGVGSLLVSNKWAVNFARTRVSDATAFAFYQAAAQHFLGRNRSWGERIRAVSQIADETHFQSLKLTNIPDEQAQSLVYDGLLPNGRPVGYLQPARVTEHHLGVAVRSAMTLGLTTAGGSLLAWHPWLLTDAFNVINWSGAHHWLLHATPDPLMAALTGSATALGAFALRLHKTYEEEARIEFDVDTVQQMRDNPAAKSDHEASDTAFVRQTTALAADKSDRYQLGTYVGHMNRKGDFDAPLRGAKAQISDLAMCQHIAVTGATGEGKSKTVFEPLLIQMFAFCVNTLIELSQLAFSGEAMEGDDLAAVHYRNPRWAVKMLSAFLVDPKGMLAVLAHEIGEQLGLSGNVRWIGPRVEDGEFTVDLFAGLVPQKAFDLLQDAVSRGTTTSDKIWGDLAKNIERAALTLAHVWGYTPEGEHYARTTLVKPYSPVFLSDLIFDPTDTLISQLLGDIDAAVHAGNMRVRSLVNELFISEVNLLLGKDWLGGGGGETMYGIRINVQQHLSPLTSNPELRRTFGSGYSKNLMPLNQFWGLARFTASNVSETIYGEPAKVINTFLKSRFLTEADAREGRFAQKAVDAAKALREIHLHLFQQELADETALATKTYLAKQQAAWPILVGVARDLAPKGRWPYGQTPAGAPLFGPGPQQSQFRRAVRWIDRELDRIQPLLAQPLSKFDLEDLHEPDRFAQSNTTNGFAAATGALKTSMLAQGVFVGTSRSMHDLLGCDQLGLEDVIRGVREEEDMLATYIENLGAPASPNEGLIAIPKAIERIRMMFMVDEYTSMATRKLDGDSVKQARSKGLSWIAAWQTFDALAQALGSAEAAREFLDNLRTRIVLADESETTLQIIRNLAGQLPKRHQPRTNKAEAELPFEELLYHALADSNGSDLSLSVPRADPAYLDDRCAFTLEWDEKQLRLERERGDVALGVIDTLARPLAMNEGRSWANTPDFKSYRPINDGTEAGINALRAFDKAEKQSAEGKEADRFNAPTHQVDPITRKDWARNNRVAIFTLTGRRPVLDLADLDVNTKAILMTARRKLEDNQRDLEAKGLAFADRQDARGSDAMAA